MCVEATLDTLRREKSRQLLARIAYLTGDLDLAEDAIQEAFTAAVRQWPSTGIPSNPSAWLYQTARFKAIDLLRAKGRTAWLDDADLETLAHSAPDGNVDLVEDEILRLIFTCCHPSLSVEAQIALTLREVCDLTTEEIARAFLLPVPTVAQRIVRAKAKIREAVIPFEEPSQEELPTRLPPVLRALYLVFNEGYYATSGEAAVRTDLVREAIRLASLLANLVPEPEIVGLLALMLLHEARRASRLDAEGEIILLEHQDRTKWDKELIGKASDLVRQALQTQRFGPYTLQAAILAVHAEAQSYDETDWAEIVGLYDLLLQFDPSPVVALNRAVAVTSLNGPAEGLVLIEGLFQQGVFEQYLPAYVARAYCRKKMGDKPGAHADYAAALELARQEPERRFLAACLDEVS